MENFELIDDYLRGRLEGQDKQNFEQQLQADSSLQNEVVLQKAVIEGIKKARVAELKTMLSQVPVTGLMTQAGISATQMAVGVFTAGAILTGTIFYFKPWEEKSTAVEQKIEKPATEKIIPKEPEVVTPENKEEKTIAAEPKKVAKAKVTSSKKIIPKLQVTDPTDELTNTSSTKDKAQEAVSHGEVSVSRVEVEIKDNSTYSFHYQFTEGKLILYGSFDKSLYEIIEVNGDARALFLFYKDSYYLLDERQSSITPLLPIKDAQLIRKLKAYRNK